MSVIDKALGYLDKDDYTEDEIKEYLANNLCRCSGYEGQMRGIRRYIEWKKQQNRKEAAAR